MMDKIKVLQIIGSMNIGGAETVIMNLYRKIDKRKIQFDFFVSNPNNDYDEEINNMGGVIYHTVKKSKHPIKYCIDMYRLIKQNKYPIVHVHASNSLAVIPIFIAKCAKVKKRIIHSHTSNNLGRKNILHNAMRIVLNAAATDKFSCSDSAARWMYGRKEKESIIINNPIDCELYKFDEKKRGNIRYRLGLDEEKKTYVHVGRYSPEKNHKFLIDIFHEIYKKDSNSILLLIGEGDMKQEIESKVENLNLKESVLFLGIRHDVHNVLQACDAFIFPSLYEGLPLTVLEAQANGLTCFISDVISGSIDITDLITRIPLKDSPQKWADIICEQKKVEAREKYSEIVGKNYDANYVSQLLTSFYTNGQ